MNDWEKEFDKWFGHGKRGHLHGLLAEDYYKEVKNFIRNLLSKQDAEIKLLQIYKQKYDKAAKEVENIRKDNFSIKQAMSELGKRSAQKNKRDYSAMGKKGGWPKGKKRKENA